MLWIVYKAVAGSNVLNLPQHHWKDCAIMRKAVRQGDVLLWPVDKAHGIKLPSRRGRVIVAEGERSGHDHSLPGGKSTMLWNEEGVSIQTTNTSVAHQEHDPLPVDGDYDVVQQRRAASGTMSRPMNFD